MLQALPERRRQWRSLLSMERRSKSSHRTAFCSLLFQFLVYVLKVGDVGGNGRRSYGILRRGNIVRRWGLELVVTCDVALLDSRPGSSQTDRTRAKAYRPYIGSPEFAAARGRGESGWSGKG